MNQVIYKSICDKCNCNLALTPSVSSASPELLLYRCDSIIMGCSSSSSPASMDGADRFPAHELKRKKDKFNISLFLHCRLSYSLFFSLSSFQLLNNGMMTFDSNFLGGKRVPGPK